MDIRKFAAEPTTKLHLRDADGELMYADAKQTKPMTVTLYGPASKPYAKAQAAQQNRMIDMIKRKGKSEKTAEQKSKENAEFLADCTVSFENVELDALTGYDLALAVYSELTIGFIADQVAAHIVDWANFTKGSAKN